MSCGNLRTVEEIKADIVVNEDKLKNLKEELKKATEDKLVPGTLYQHKYDKNIRVLLRIENLYYLVHIHEGPNNYKLNIGTGGETSLGRTETKMREMLNIWKKISGPTTKIPVTALSALC